MSEGEFTIMPPVVLLMHTSDACLGSLCAECGLCEQCGRIIGSPHLPVCACPPGTIHKFCQDHRRDQSEEN